MTRAILLALALSVGVCMTFFSYTAGLIEGVKMSHIHLPPPSDIGF